MSDERKRLTVTDVDVTWAHLSAAHAEGYAQCQRDVVAWLTSEACPRFLVDRIEAGAHVGAAKGGPNADR